MRLLQPHQSNHDEFGPHFRVGWIRHSASSLRRVSTKQSRHPCYVDDEVRRKGLVFVEVGSFHHVH